MGNSVWFASRKWALTFQGRSRFEVLIPFVSHWYRWPDSLHSSQVCCFAVWATDHFFFGLWNHQFVVTFLNGSSKKIRNQQDLQNPSRSVCRSTSKNSKVYLFLACCKHSMVGKMSSFYSVLPKMQVMPSKLRPVDANSHFLEGLKTLSGT